MTDFALRLPKAVEADESAAGLARELERRAEPLWSDGTWPVAKIGRCAEVDAALRAAFSSGRLVRGLEEAQRALAAEERGLSHVDRKTGVARGGRVSRLLVISDDGAERFYRHVESLLKRHAPRVLALRMSIDEAEMGEVVFGSGHVARLLLVEHKDAVSSVLLAAAAAWRGSG